jgi:septum formation protein
MKLYLASSSPRRIKLLKWFGLPFKTIDHGFDEESISAKDSETLVGQLALQKINSAAARISDPALIIGSDLVVSIDGNSWSKPKNLNEARKMLKTIRGRRHQIMCGVAVLDTKNQKAVMSVAKTRVWIKNFSDEILEKYLIEVPVLGRGGAYGVQDVVESYGTIIKKFEGEITTILGLPLEHLENLLKEFNFKPKKDWRKTCKMETGYEV